MFTCWVQVAHVLGLLNVFAWTVFKRMHSTHELYMARYMTYIEMCRLMAKQRTLLRLFHPKYLDHLSVQVLTGEITGDLWALRLDQAYESTVLEIQRKRRRFNKCI